MGNQFGNVFGNGLGNRGRGAFRVAPGRVGKVMAQTVCLEHGKPDPTSKIKYRIVPLDQVGKHRSTRDRDLSPVGPATYHAKRSPSRCVARDRWPFLGRTSRQGARALEGHRQR